MSAQAPPTPTLEWLVGVYVDERIRLDKISDNHSCRTRKLLAEFGERFGAQPLADMTREDIDDWSALYGLHLKPYTRAKEVRMVFRFLRWLAKNGHIASEIVMPKPPEDDFPLLALHIEHIHMRNLRPNTIRQRRQVLRRFRWHLGHDPLDATPAELSEWWAGLTTSAKSRNVELTSIRAFYRWAILEDLIVADPSRRLIAPKVPRALPRPIGDVELRKALAQAPARVRPWLFLAAYAGLRACEIAGLRREDIHQSANPPVLLVADGKGGHQRVIPFADVLATEIATWDLSRRGWLFHTRNSFAPVTAHMVSRGANRYLRSIGISDTLHSLRHWFATTVYAMTSDLRLVQEILGHASPLTTARYAAWSPSKAATAIRTLSLSAGGDPTPMEIRPPQRAMHAAVVSAVTQRRDVQLHARSNESRTDQPGRPANIGSRVVASRFAA